MVNSGTRVISEYGNKCILSILHHVKAPKVLSKMQEEIKSKNANIRVKSSIYLLVILKTYECEDLERHTGEVEDMISKLI